MAELRRRAYRNLGEVSADLSYLTRHWRTLWSLRRASDVPPAFRERLMLTVTGVNQCRYCAHVHAQLGVRAGLDRSEADALLGGTVHDAPDHERPALYYALHWAERDAAPETIARRELAEIYGTATAERIEAVLRTIRVGNLAGNAWDRLLCKVTGVAEDASDPMRGIHPRPTTLPSTSPQSAPLKPEKRWEGLHV